MECGHQQIALGGAWVDEATQYGSVFEQGVEPLHAISEPAVVTGELQPVFLLRIRSEAGAGQVHRRKPKVADTPPCR